jgi:DNA repair protein RadC
LEVKKHVMRQVRVYQGNLSASDDRVWELFTEAVWQLAAGIILVHNHSSGGPDAQSRRPPSGRRGAGSRAAPRHPEVLDHLVVTRDSDVSLRSQGVSFDRQTA